MKRLMVFLGAALAMTGSSAWAQYNTSPIEKMCYGGRNQMGLHVCVCDQSFISGMSALILGNSVVLHGPGKLMDCLVWADEMNGVPGGSSGVPAQPPQPPVALPKTPVQTPAYSSVAPLLPSAGPCGKAFNACNAARQPECMNKFNACTTAQVDQARATAVQNQLLSPEDAARLAALSQTSEAGHQGYAASLDPGQTEQQPTIKRNVETLVDNWNTGACGLTDTARFSLKVPSHLQRLETWIDWSEAQGNATAARLWYGESTLPLTFKRGKCHPSMPEWCYGIAQLDQTLPAGDVTIKASEGVLCHNAASGNNGYIKVFGFPSPDGVQSNSESKETRTLRRPTRNLPPLSVKPPALGMPGNRRGTGGPRYYVD